MMAKSDVPSRWRLNWALPDGVHALSADRWWSTDGDHNDSDTYAGFNVALHVGDDADAVESRRRALQRQLVGVHTVQWLDQVHGTDVVEAGGEVASADACVTERAGVACAVMTADCLPVLFCSDDGQRVAAAHAGWRGLANGILLNTLAHFDARSVRVHLAPAIGAHAFEIGDEVRAAFSWASGDCFIRHNGRLMANLYALAREQLESAGVVNISGGKGCTFADTIVHHQTCVPRYYSYRRDGVTGRQVSLIWRQR